MNPGCGQRAGSPGLLSYERAGVVAERIRHPISKLEFFLEHTRRWLVDVRANAEAWEEARTKPQLLADIDGARVKRVSTEQVGDLTLFKEQAVVWGQPTDLSRCAAGRTYQATRGTSARRPRGWSTSRWRTGRSRGTGG